MHFVKYKSQIPFFILVQFWELGQQMPKNYYWKVQRFLQCTWFRSEHWLLISTALLWNYSSKTDALTFIMRFLMSDAECNSSLIFVLMDVCDGLTRCCKYGTSTLSERRDWKIVSVILKAGYNACWETSNCFFKVHDCTGVQISSICTQATPDLFSDQTSLQSLCLSFIPPSQLLVWRISCCSQPWDWKESFCLALCLSSIREEEEDRSGRLHFIY